MIREKTTAEIRREVQASLTGLGVQAAERLVRVNSRWVEVLAEQGDPEQQARAATQLTECERIATLMRDRGWDRYLPSKDPNRR